MLRRIIAGTAVAGALTLGVAGVAGAATPSSGTSTSYVCRPRCVAGWPKIEARVQTFEAKVNARIPKAQAREAKATDRGTRSGPTGSPPASRRCRTVSRSSTPG